MRISTGLPYKREIVDRRNFFMKLLLSFLFFTVILFPPPNVSGQIYAVEQARNEGEVVLYSTITVGAFNELNKAIKEKYPFLNVHHIRLGPAQQLARIMQEQSAGHFVADVIYNNLLHLIYLKENAILGKYESPEKKFLMKEAVDADGFWVGGDIDILVTGFNTNMISRKDVPTTYDGFLHGKLKGQMAVNSNNPYAARWNGESKRRGAGNRVHAKASRAEPSAGARFYPYGQSPSRGRISDSAYESGHQNRRA